MKYQKALGDPATKSGGTYGGAQKALMVGQVKGMDEATMNAIADLIIK